MRSFYHLRQHRLSTGCSTSRIASANMQHTQRRSGATARVMPTIARAAWRRVSTVCSLKRIPTQGWPSATPQASSACVRPGGNSCNRCSTCTPWRSGTAIPLLMELYLDGSADLKRRSKSLPTGLLTGLLTTTPHLHASRRREGHRPDDLAGQMVPVLRWRRWAKRPMRS